MTETGKNEGASISSGWITRRPIRTVRELSERLDTDPRFVEEVRKDPAGTIAKVAGSPIDTDVWIYRIVVGVLGIAVLGTVAGSIYLATLGQDRKVPEVVVAMGSAAVGALAGLLTPARKSGSEGR